MVLLAIAVALATRLPMIVNLVTCLMVFVSAICRGCWCRYRAAVFR